MTEEEFEKLNPGDKVTLLPWEEAKKAVRGTMYDCDDSIYGISDTTWEIIRRTNEFIDNADDDASREFDKLYKFISLKGAGFTWHIPKCCVVGEVGKRVAGKNDIIEILTRGNKTIAKRGGKVGIARRSPQDKPDEAKGIIIAVARLYGYDVVTDGEGAIELASKEKIIKEIGEKPTEKPSGEKEYELLPWDEAREIEAMINRIGLLEWKYLTTCKIIDIDDIPANDHQKCVTFKSTTGDFVAIKHIPAYCIREKRRKL